MTINVQRSACKVLCFCQMLMELGYSLQNVEKQLNIKFHDTVHSGSTVVPCGVRVRRTGERHDKADSWF